MLERDISANNRIANSQNKSHPLLRDLRLPSSLLHNYSNNNNFLVPIIKTSDRDDVIILIDFFKTEKPS